jgi:hypothetical protein
VREREGEKHTYINTYIAIAYIHTCIHAYTQGTTCADVSFFVSHQVFGREHSISMRKLQVTRWYLNWKSLFPPNLAGHDKIKVHFTRALDMMNNIVTGAQIVGGYVQPGTKENLDYLKVGCLCPCICACDLRIFACVYRPEKDVLFCPRVGTIFVVPGYFQAVDVCVFCTPMSFIHVKKYLSNLVFSVSCSCMHALYTSVFYT